MPLESIARTQPGLLLPPLSRSTFEQLGVVVEVGDGGSGGEGGGGDGGGSGGGGARDGDGDGDGDDGAMVHRGVGYAAALRRARRLPLTPEQDFQLRRAITGLHTWLGALAVGQGEGS
jgi:hypothetical protein